MRKIPKLATVLITSLVLVIAGLVASPIATASENEFVRVSATFPSGSWVLTNTQKAEIKKTLASSGTDATFVVTGIAGKLFGVSDRQVKALAEARAKAIKAYLLSLGVSETSVTTEAKMTKIGVAPKIENVYFTSAPTPTPTATAVATDSAPAAPAAPAAPTYAVGDRGPGGGIVFYVSATSFASPGSTCDPNCKYLEVAPATWQSAGMYVANDATYVLSTEISVVTGQDLALPSVLLPSESGLHFERQNWKIGEGFNNTFLIKANSAAKDKVLLYAGTNASIGQWFIPSMNELNELCKYAFGQATGVLTVQCNPLTGTLKTGTANDLGGFVGSVYHSSSENDVVNSMGTNFTLGGAFSSHKANTSKVVRPIRAF